MKMNLDMSFEEGLNIVKALRDCAISNGWNEDELDECGVIEEYSSAVDAALAAMGIAALAAMGIAASIDIEPDPEVEDDDDFDDEEWDEDDEDGYFNSDYDDDDELSSDDEVFELIKRIIYGQ